MHLEGQLVGRDPRRELGVIGAKGAMSLVLFAEAIEQQAAGRAVGAFGNGKVVDRHIPGAEDGALKGRRHVAARPVLGAADRAAGAVEHHHEARQVLVLAAQAVGHPRAKTGMPADDPP